MHICPSLISSDLLNLKQTLASFDPIVDGYHIDVMDDHFVPNLTWGPAFINAIRHSTQQPLVIHLMVDRPVTWPSRLSLKPTDTIIYHHEAISDTSIQKELIQHVHSKEWKIGIAINPTTPIESIFDMLSLVDVILLMSVKPGFSGQLFIPDVMKKIEPLITMRSQHNYKFTISMDGGINEKNIHELAQAKIDSVAVAAAIFQQPDPIHALKNLKNLSSQG
jgi:ribulose-phosphate 3-epimerase